MVTKWLKIIFSETTWPINHKLVRKALNTYPHRIINFRFKCGDGRVVQRCWVNFQCLGVLLIWIIVGQGPVALAVSAGWGCFSGVVGWCEGAG